MLRTTVGRLRAAGMVEAVSFLLLLGVAMPLKYFAGMPLAVKFAGWIHGLLFLAFCRVFARRPRRTAMADALDGDDFRRGIVAVRAVCHRSAA